jgi:hypothetical protein
MQSLANLARKMATTTTTKRIVRVLAHGGTEALQVDRDVDLDVNFPAPASGGGFATIDVAASGVNMIDTYHRSGLYKLPFPIALGREGVGIITHIDGDFDKQACVPVNTDWIWSVYYFWSVELDRGKS